MVHFITGNDSLADIEEVMNNVNNHVNFRETGEDSFEFTQKEYHKLLEIANDIGLKWKIEVDVPILSIGRFSKLKILFKSVILKCCKWYVRDVENQQMEFNEKIVQFVNLEVGLIGKMNAELIELRKENEKGKDRSNEVR